MDLVNRINLLPIDIQEKIYKYYWSKVYSKVIEEFKKPFEVNEKVLLFVKKHINSIVENHILYYYKQLNNLIKTIVENRGQLFICKKCKLQIFWSSDDWHIKHPRLKEDYKYITPIILALSGHYRYQTFEKILNYN